MDSEWLNFSDYDSQQLQRLLRRCCNADMYSSNLNFIPRITDRPVRQVSSDVLHSNLAERFSCEIPWITNYPAAILPVSLDTKATTSRLLNTTTPTISEVLKTMIATRFFCRCQLIISTQYSPYLYTKDETGLLDRQVAAQADHSTTYLSLKLERRDQLKAQKKGRFNWKIVAPSSKSFNNSHSNSSE